MHILPDTLEAGSAYPLGATFDGLGVNFAVYSANAEKIELCVYDENGRRELKRYPLTEWTDEVWHGYLPDAQPGLAYGYRAYGREHLEGLSFVRHCRALDIPLADIKKLLDFTTSPLEDCADINLLVDEQIERVRARLKSLKALEKQLTALRAQCAQGHRARECGILGELVSAAHGEACICHA